MKYRDLAHKILDLLERDYPVIGGAWHDIDSHSDIIFLIEDVIEDHFLITKSPDE